MRIIGIDKSTAAGGVALAESGALGGRVHLTTDRDSIPSG